MSFLSDVQLLDETDSTNSHALRNFASLQHGALIVAAAQSAGKGRKGRLWSSPKGVNVYATLVVKGFKFLPSQAAWIGSLAALASLRAEAPSLKFSVKWPNDVLCGGTKKIAGVLAETKAGANGGMALGIGVNLNMSAADLAALGRPATSLLCETGKAVESVEAFAIALGEEAMRLYDMASTSGIDALYKMWSAETELSNARVEVLADDGSSFFGTVEALRLDGSLAIRRNDGKLVSVTAGEVSLKKA